MGNLGKGVGEWEVHQCNPKGRKPRKLLRTKKKKKKKKYGTVVFVGYKNEETAWLDELKPSQGEEARKLQEKMAGSMEQLFMWDTKMKRLPGWKN
jgi:hypothetical protein